MIYKTFSFFSLIFLWSTEPIWTTNQKAGDGRRSAAEWVGAGITFDNQEIINIPYNRSKPYKELIDEFIGFYTEDIEPINFAALYFDEPGKNLTDL